MKKLIQISLVVVIAITLVAGLVLAPDVWVNVGWNTRSNSAQSQSLQVAGCNFCKVAPPDVLPNVGWNTRS